MITIIVLAVVFSIVSGYKEGMTMIKFSDKMHNPEFKEGVRGHRFFRFYHWLDRIFYPAFAALVYIAITNPPHISTCIGIAILIWELRECGYNLARYLSVFAKTENIYGFGLNIRGSEVVVLHIVRTTVALMFLYGGIA